MIVLDSNVVSALMRIESEPAVAAWLAHQNIERLVTTAPTFFEIQFGIEAKPQGRRRRALEESFASVIDGVLARRILTFDEAAAAAGARARAIQRRRGLTASVPDSQIAGIAMFHGHAIATRNVADFAHLGLPLINPWVDGA
jgi:toxin FitB